MYQPKYTITSPILKNVGLIEAAPVVRSPLPRHNFADVGGRRGVPGTTLRTGRGATTGHAESFTYVPA